jgi:hypothetical protein
MGEYDVRMALRLFLSSGGQRTIDAADSARGAESPEGWSQN